MARIDKYEPKAGGFRAPLSGPWAGSATPIGVGLDASGRVVAGAGQSGIMGVLCKPDASALLASDIVDIMTAGELVEFAGVAGTAYTAHTTDGAISSAAPDATHIAIGATVEATRLVVRMKSGVTGAGVSGGQANIVSLTDNTTGTANNVLEAIASPADTPATADALRDDLVANALPSIRNNFADLAAKVNAILTALDAAGLTT